MKKLAIYIALMTALCATNAAFSKTFQWRLNGNETHAAQWSAYHGETVLFEVTNRTESLVASCIYYQTNGMADAWWQTDGMTFAPSNDVGAAIYRIFVRAADSQGVNYTANGTLRMLPSPGFTPNTISPPVASLDFNYIDVFNAPWVTPEDLSSATNRALVRAREHTDTATNSLAVALREEIASATPGDYYNVSNKAYTALQEHQSLTNYYTKAVVNNIANNIYDYISTSFYDFENETLPDTPVITNINSKIANLEFNVDAIWDESAAHVNEDILYDVAHGDTSSEIAQKLVAAINAAETDPTVHDYETVSNRAMNAIQEHQSLTNYYTRSEVASALAPFASEDFVVDKVNVSDRLILAITQGTNIIAVVTNYDSQVSMPSLSLKYLDGTNGYVTVWDELTQLEAATNSALELAREYTASATNTLEAAKADRAWSHHTSGLGEDAPSNTTWISTPNLVIAGGFEYQKNITSSGEVWILTSNGLDLGLVQSQANAFLDISAADGTPIFSIQKTDSYLVGVNPSAISTVGSTCIVSVPFVGDHPYARICTNLTNAVWYKEDEDGMPSGSPATVTWSGSSGAYVATIDFGSNSQGFAWFEAVVEGETKIVNNAVLDVTPGLYYNDVKYYPSVNGNKLEFFAR